MQGEIEGGTSFGSYYATLGALIKGEAEWIIGWICAHSNATPDDLLRAKKTDKDALGKIIQTETQLELKTKLSKDTNVKDIMWQILGRLSTRFGSRLRNGDLGAAINQTGEVDYLSLSPYNFSADANHVITEMHFGTSPALPTLTDAKFDETSYGIKNVYIDMQASFFKAHTSPTHLHTFFAKKVGPKLLESPNKGDTFEILSKQCVQEFQEKINRAKHVQGSLATASGAGGSVKQDLVKIETEERSKRMEALRLKSKETLQQNMTKKVSQLQKDTKLTKENA